MAAPPKPPTPADWLRRSGPAREILHAAVESAGVPADWQARAGDRRKVMAAVVASGVAEIGSLADGVIAGSLTLARWAAGTRDALATHALAAVVAILGTPDDGGATVPSLYDALPGSDGAALGRLAARLLADADSIVAAVKAGRLMVKPESAVEPGIAGAGDDPEAAADPGGSTSEFRHEAVAMAARVGDLAGAVKAGRDGEKAAKDDGALDGAARLWRELAPDWARGLIDAQNDGEGE